MKTFNFKIKFLILLLSVSITSCEDFLEETNLQSISVESARENADNFDKLLNAVYEVSRQNTTRYASDMLYALEDQGTDIVTRAGLIAGTNALNDYVDLNASNYVVQVYWGNQYQVIATANTLISNAELITGIDESVRTKGVAEAKFFRAWSYFNLVENYGGVPLITEQITSARSDFERNSEEDVYALIVSDLQEAISNTDENPSTYGKVSKDAARHLLSKVLLTRGYKGFAESDDFSRAVTLAETVIASHPLEPSFGAVVSIDNQRNDEVIFSYLFGSETSSIGWGNTKHMLYKFEYFNYPGLERGTLYQNGMGRMPTPFFYDLFATEDTRDEESFRFVLYADQESNDGTIKVGDTAIYFPKTNWTQQRIDSKPYVVINPDQYFTNDGVTTSHWPMMKKFDNPGAPFVYADQPALGTRDMVMMRGGEAYLIAAEAYLQMNETGTAANLLTSLRSRAGITTPLNAEEVTINFILDERARELIGEVNRWMDLKRTGTLIERVLMYNPHARLNNAISEKHYLRPIPQYEIDASAGAITQNPNY